MLPLIAIAKLTLKANLRSRLFLFITPVILLLSWYFSAIDFSDGTMRGLYRLRLEYGLNVALFFLAFTTLWLSVMSISQEEVESLRMWALQTRPLRGWQFWCGKMLGNLTLPLLVYAMVVIISGASVNSHYQQKKQELKPQMLNLESYFNSKYPENRGLSPLIAPALAELRTVRERLYPQAKIAELPDASYIAPESESAELKRLFKRADDLLGVELEVMTLRRRSKVEVEELKLPTPEEVIQQRQQAGKKPNASSPEEQLANVSRELDLLRRSLPQGKSRTFTFSSIDKNAKGTAFLRTRFLSLMADYEDYGLRPLRLKLEAWDPKEDAWSKEQIIGARVNRFFNIAIPDQFISEQGEVRLRLENISPKINALTFGGEDGPYILFDEASFSFGLFQVWLFACLLLALFSAAGCAFATACKTAVALIVGMSYFLIGFSLQKVLESEQEMQLSLLYYFHRFIAMFCAGSESFAGPSYFLRGQFLGWGELCLLFFSEGAVKMLLLLGLALFAYRRRQFGAVLQS